MYFKQYHMIQIVIQRSRKTKYTHVKRIIADVFEKN